MCITLCGLPPNLRGTCTFNLVSCLTRARRVYSCVFLCSWKRRWNTAQSSGVTNEQEGLASSVYGFGSISRRSTSCKPLIAAVDGGAYGGGTEMVLNCDLVVTDESAKFALPEVKRGVVAAQGGKSGCLEHSTDFLLFSVLSCPKSVCYTI